MMVYILRQHQLHRQQNKEQFNFMVIHTLRSFAFVSVSCSCTTNHFQISSWLSRFYSFMHVELIIVYYSCFMALPKLYQQQNAHVSLGD